MLRKTGSLRWPRGGVFVPKNWAPATGWPEPLDHYDPVAEARTILRDVQRIDLTDEGALLRFVNKWGRLGVGIGDDPLFRADGVRRTRQWLRRISTWLEGYRARQRGEASTPTWEQLGQELNPLLAGINPVAHITDSRLEPAFRPKTLLQALYLELWKIATDGHLLRRCPGCLALFIPGRANQYYCDHACANRMTVRRARDKRKAARMNAIGSFP